MQNLSQLIHLARLSGPWASSRIGRLMPASPRVLGRLTVSQALALLMVGAIASPALAARSSRFELTADGRLVDVQVLVDGHAAPLYFPNGGHDRRYFQAFKGRNYSLAIRNNTGRRIGVLIAVDGLNVVNGERSRLASGEAMYVLDPWERSVIRGWRSSLNDVRRFVFVDEERSYAERTGQANGDMGWIRVLAFNEQHRPWYQEVPGRIKDSPPRTDDDNWIEGSREKRGAEESQRPNAVPAPPATPEAERQEGDQVAPRSGAVPNKSQYRDDSPSAESVPGTGWGERRYDPVNRVWFVPERRATDHLVFRYEYTSGLRALGIYPRGTRDRLREREDGELGFAQPPRW